MNKDLICKMYQNGKSMRQIALELNTNHKRISKILKNNNIKTREPMNLRDKKNFKCDKERLYNNMAIHLRFNVDYKWLMQFEDFEKLKLLNHAITDRGGRWVVDTKWYKEYLLKFYDDKQFNSIYFQWCTNNCYKYLKPSLDHIIPKAKGGTNNLDNLQFLSWFENRCKNDMTQEEWNKLKSDIKEYLILK